MLLSQDDVSEVGNICVGVMGVDQVKWGPRWVIVRHFVNPCQCQWISIPIEFLRFAEYEGSYRMNCIYSMGCVNCINLMGDRCLKSITLAVNSKCESKTKDVSRIANGEWIVWWVYFFHSRADHVIFGIATRVVCCEGGENIEYCVVCYPAVVCKEFILDSMIRWYDEIVVIPLGQRKEKGATHTSPGVSCGSNQPRIVTFRTMVVHHQCQHSRGV